MVTPELLNYIKIEFSKGRTREEIRATLVSEGGWIEEDLNEAFRTAIPMQNIVSPQGKSSVSRIIKILFSLILLAGVCFGVWYYRLKVEAFWDSLVGNYSSLQVQFLGTKNKIPTTKTSEVKTIIPSEESVTDCGTSVAPKFGVPATYEKNPVLLCLGASAFYCKNARGILTDNFFPTIFEITKTENSCNFKLSYGADSTLVDITGKKLALQFISCPVNIVKAIDNTNTSSPKFSAPDTKDFAKYATEIYTYGTLGLFSENNFDQNKIGALGCGGEYVLEIISSFKAKNK